METFYNEEYNVSLRGAVMNVVLSLLIFSIVIPSIFVILSFIPMYLGIVPSGTYADSITNLLVNIFSGILMFLFLFIIGLVLMIVPALLLLFIGSLILYAMSRILGGEGDFVTQTYMLSIIIASELVLGIFIGVFLILINITPIVLHYMGITIISESISNIIDSLSGLIVIIFELYYMYIITVILRETHSYGTFKALLNWLIPGLLLVGIVVILLLFLFMLPVSTINLDNSIQTTGLTAAYTDNRYNFHVDYPIDWIQNETSSGIYFSSPVDDALFSINVRENVGDMSLIGVSKIMGIEMVYKVKGLPYEILSYDSVDIDGEKAYQIVSEVMVQDKKVRVKEVFIVKNGTAYVLQYTAQSEPDDAYSRYEGIIDKCIDSFSFVGVGKREESTVPQVKTHETIKTSEFSYELYLPEDCSPRVSYPLLLCMSPNGDGKVFYNSVYPVTDEYNYVLVGSNDYSNYKPLDEFLPRIYNTLDDVRTRVNIDENRIYACGFSGGGMATYVVSYFKPNYFRGLIVNDGAIHVNLYNVEMLRQMGVERVVLICGKKDTTVSCSYMQDDANWLNQAGIETKIIEFDGGHQIAPSDAYREAIRWLEF